jgi:prepilin-type N-terminal cleavage/methylation domain-containing protein
MSRRGFSIVEVLVAMMIGVILGAIVWSIFWADQRRFFTDQGRISGLRGVLMFDEALSRDLHRLALFLGETRSSQYHLGDPVEIADGGRTLTFMAAAGPATGAKVGVFPTEMVSYQLDRASGEVFRVAADRADVFRSIQATALTFALVSLKPLAGLDPGPAYNAAEPVWAVKYHITCHAPDLPETALPGAAETGRITLVGAVPLKYQRQRVQHPYWMPTRNELPAMPGEVRP